MFAGAGALQANGPLHHLHIELFHRGHLGRVVGVHQVAQVKVAITHVADDPVRDTRGLGLGNRVIDALGQARDGHAGVAALAAAAWPRLQRRKVGLVARRPQPRALFGRAGPLKVLATVVTRQVLHGLRLFRDTRLAAVKLHQQHRCFAQPQLGMAVDGANGIGVQQLAARNGHAHLDDLDGGLHRRVNARKVADRRAHRLGQRVELERDFGHHAQRAFAAHEQARQVVAGAGLARPRAGAHDLPAGGDHGQAEDVFTHGPVAHGIRAAGARGRHAAQRGIGAGVDGEEQARVADLAVELFARDAGLHGHRQVFGIHLHDVVHAAQVHAQPALHGQQMAFERGAHAVRDHGHRILVRQGQHDGDLFAAFAKEHRVRGRRVVDRFTTAMMLAHRSGGGAAVAEALAQCLQQGRRGRAQGTWPHSGFGLGCVHGGLLAKSGLRAAS